MSIDKKSMATPSHGFLGALLRLFRKPPIEQLPNELTAHQWQVDRLWFRSSDAGEKWIFARILESGSDENTQSAQSPWLDIRAIALGCHERERSMSM